MYENAHIALIANPRAGNGRGEDAARKVLHLLGSKLGQAHLSLTYTENAAHATEIIANLSSDIELVVAIGGDGVINEVVNGLMLHEEGQRPALGVIPLGTGNDYAATLGISLKIAEAIDQLVAGKRKQADVGVCNGKYFAETLSFGLDAAIAAGVMKRRKKNGRSGKAAYLMCGFDQLFFHLKPTSYKADFEDPSGIVRSVTDKAYLFAVQIGPTYGGRFRVCPDARIDDGLFDICIAHPPLNPLTATAVFLSAKNGHHTNAKNIEMSRVRSLKVHFEEPPAAQLDGEPIVACDFDVSLIPRALTVITS